MEWIKKVIEFLGLVSYKDPHEKWNRYRQEQARRAQTDDARRRDSADPRAESAGSESDRAQNS